MGYWTFEVAANGPIATYNDDASHPLDGTSYAYDAADCNLQATNDAGEWVEVSFTRVFGN